MVDSLLFSNQELLLIKNSLLQFIDEFLHPRTILPETYYSAFPIAVDLAIRLFGDNLYTMPEDLPMAQA